MGWCVARLWRVRARGGPYIEGGRRRLLRKGAVGGACWGGACVMGGGLEAGEGAVFVGSGGHGGFWAALVSGVDDMVIAGMRAVEAGVVASARACAGGCARSAFGPPRERRLQMGWKMWWCFARLRQVCACGGPYIEGGASCLLRKGAVGGACWGGKCVLCNVVCVVGWKRARWLGRVGFVVLFGSGCAGRDIGSSRSLSCLKAGESGAFQHFFWRVVGGRVVVLGVSGGVGNDIALAPASSHAKAWESGVA